MNFEHALEAMKQGKSVIYKGNKSHYILSVFDDYIIEIDNDHHIGDVDVAFRSSWLLGDGWEIYEEPLKEPEMTAEHAIEILKSARKSYMFIPDIDGAIDFAIEAIGKQNQFEEADDLNSDNESVNIERAQKKYNTVIEELYALLDFYKDNDIYRQKIKNAIKRLEEDTEPEHKYNACQCNCSHTGKNSDLQVEMEQALSRKFFELVDTTTDSLAVSNMIEIYKLLFEVK